MKNKKKEINEAIKKEKECNGSKEKELEEITSLLKTVQADFENYQKRTEKEKKDFVDYSCQEILKDILPILDSFELALKNTKNKDIEAIYKQLNDLLKSKGLERIKALDCKFDPYLHEALMQEESDKESGTVIEELQSGYKLKEIILRHTKVKIAK